MAAVSPILVILLIAVAIVTLVLIVLVVQSRRSTTTTTSTTSTSTCTNAPSAPGTITISNPQADILTLSWSPVFSATSYTAYISTSPGFSESQALQTRDTKSTAISFGNLTLGLTYYGKVKATNQCGTSAFSPESSYTLVYQFPQRFIMSPANFPTYHVCDFHTDIFGATDKLHVDRFCNDADQRMFRQESDKTIRQSARPNYCLTRDPGAALFFHPCIVNATQQWTYNITDNSLCSASSPNANCILTAPGFHGTDTQEEMTYGSKTDPAHYAFNINAV